LSLIATKTPKNLQKLPKTIKKVNKTA